MIRILKRPVRISAAGVAVVLVLGCANVKSADDPLVRAYSNAESVTPTWNSGISPAEPMWSRTVEIAGASVTVSARCCVGQRFVARYSDEPAPRTIFTPGDYVYPTDLRLDPDQRIVYGRASGVAGGLTNVTELFAYDLERRRLLESVKVDPKALPPVQPPASPRPGR